MCGTRTSGSLRTIYNANSYTPHTTLASGSVTDGGDGTGPAYKNLLVFASDEGSITSFSQKQFSFIAMGSGISAIQSSNLFSAIQQLRKDMGGGWV